MLIAKSIVNAATAVVLAVFAALTIPWAPGLAQGSAVDRSAVVLIYHRFGEDEIPSTNIRLEQFEAHIEELKDGGYATRELGELIARLRAGRGFQERSVVITADDGYRSVMTEAWPRLKAAGIPLALFISTDQIDRGGDRTLSWTDIRELRAEGVTIGHHGAAHLHMVDAGLEAARDDIRRASRRFQTELGFVPKTFAYPYGEYSLELAKAIEAEGFDAAFAQYSGAIASGGDAFALPRFPLNERYGGTDRFKLVASARALPISAIVPRGPVITGDDANPPNYGFTVDPGVRGLSALACFPSHLGRAADLEVIGKNRVEVRFDKPMPVGRNRINCTMPGPDRRWYWLGKFFYVME